MGKSRFRWGFEVREDSGDVFRRIQDEWVPWLMEWSTEADCRSWCTVRPEVELRVLETAEPPIEV